MFLMMLGFSARLYLADRNLDFSSHRHGDKRTSCLNADHVTVSVTLETPQQLSEGSVKH